MDVVYTYCMPGVFADTGDVPFYAVARTGELLVNGVAGSVADAKARLASEYGSRFDRRYPGGYAVEWVDDPAGHAGLRKAIVAGAGLSANDHDRRA